MYVAILNIGKLGLIHWKMKKAGPANKSSRIFYGWYIAIAGLVCGSLGYGARYSFAVIFPSLLEEFKWPRDTTALMMSIHILVYGIFAPVVGSMVDRTGPRKTMVFGAVILSFGLALSRWATQPAHFYLTFGVLFGMGLCFIGSVPFTTLVQNWFEKRRGLAFSIVFFGNGLAFGLYPITAWLIHDIGWRNTFLVQGMALPAVLIPLILFVVRYHPADKGLLRDGGSSESAPARKEMRIMDPAWAAIDWTISKAVRTKRFWLLCVTTFSLWGMMQHILATHHVAFAVDAGYSKMYASSVLSLFGIVSAFASFAGLISDRIGREITLTIGTALGISGIIVLMLIRDSSHPWMLYYYTLSLGFGRGLCSPTIAAAITDIFQGARVGFIMGAIWFFFSVGGAIGPWLGGWLFELSGNYMGAFSVAIALFALGCVAIWLAAPRKVRRVMERAQEEDTRQSWS
jgi:MFS family permease